MKLFNVSKTYDIVTPESASRGDFSESGYEFEKVKMSLKEVLDEVNSLGCFENFQDGQENQSLYCSDPVTDYHDGSETRYALHIDASPRAMKRLNKLIKGMNK